MPVLPAPQLPRYLAAGQLHAVFAVTSGESTERLGAFDKRPAADPHALLAVAKAIEAVALQGGDPTLDRVHIDYLDGDREATGVHALIAHEIRSVSLFGGRRVVTVVHCDEFDFAGAAGETKARGKKKAAGDDPLEQLLANAPSEPGNPPYVLILVAEHFDKRKRAFKQLAEVGLVVEVPPLTERELQAWLEEEAQPHGIAVDRDVARMLFARLGPGDPARLRQSAARVLLDAGPNGRATAKMVHESIPLDRDTFLWDLTDAIADKDVVRALTVLDMMLGDASSSEMVGQTIGILGYLSKHYRGLLMASDFARQGRTADQLAVALEIKPYPAQKLLQQVRTLRPAQLELALANIEAAETATRSSAMGESRTSTLRWLEQLMVALCRGERLRLRRPPTVMDSL